MSTRVSFSAPLLFAAFVLVLPASSTRAEENDDAKLLVERLGQLRKAEDVGGMLGAIIESADIYKSCENPSMKGKIRAELGKIVRDKDAGDARIAAVDALIELEDPSAAWKELNKAMPGPKTEEAQPIDLAVLNAAGKMAPSKAVKSLIELAYKAKDKDMAAAAVGALGGYGTNKKNRVKILEELISVGRRTRPGRSTEKATSQVAIDRWAAVGPVLVRALNELTGQKVMSFEDWEALYKDNKKRPKDIFVREDS